HWRNKKTLCAPKCKGGLGFRDFASFNLALVDREAWRLLLNLDALWAKLLKSLYFPRSSFMEAKQDAKTILDMGLPSRL
ncbi:hypothetical protein LINPERPRIM_LOCUS5341, partial [Linum perenne]